MAIIELLGHPCGGLFVFVAEGLPITQPSYILLRTDHSAENDQRFLGKFRISFL